MAAHDVHEIHRLPTVFPQHSGQHEQPFGGQGGGEPGPVTVGRTHHERLHHSLDPAVVGRVPERQRRAGREEFSDHRFGIGR